MRTSRIVAAAVIALTFSANRAAAQPGGIGGASASPAAGSTFPWEAGLQVSTWGTVNLFNGNLLVRIPIVSWTANVFDPDFSLYHNSAAAESSLPVPGTAGFSLGPGWRIGYGGQLWFEDADTTWVIEDDGLMIEYTKVAGVWVPPTGVYASLTYDAAADEWTLTRKNQWRRIYRTDRRPTRGRTPRPADRQRGRPDRRRG